MSDAESWIDQEIARFCDKYGAVPPPWHVFSDTHPYDIDWRMAHSAFCQCDVG